MASVAQSDSNATNIVGNPAAVTILLVSIALLFDPRNLQLLVETVEGVREHLILAVSLGNATCASVDADRPVLQTHLGSVECSK